MAHALGIDLGTSNVKVALVDADGAVVATGARPLHAERDGRRAEQDAEATWSAVVAAVAEATAAAPRAAADVVGIQVCSQYSSLVPVAADGRPVGPMVLYWDTRGTAASWAILERHPEALATFVDRHGIPPVGGGLSLGHLLALEAEAEPERRAVTAAYLEPMDYVNARLTGRLAATQCTVFTLQLCDNRRVGVTAYDDELVRLAGVDPERLPPLVALDALVGDVRPDVAAALGLPPGTRVHAGMNDSQAGAVASGAYGAGVAGLAIGTTAVVLDAVDDKRVDLERELVSMPSPHGTGYLVWAENGIAGKAVAHVLDELLVGDDALGAHRAADPFARLEEVLAATAPGPAEALFLPWLAGSMAPAADRRARGAFLHLSLDTDRTDLVRAAVEGTAHNLAWLLPGVEAFTGRDVAELRFFGGAARSAGWARILADTTGRVIRPLRQPDHAVARAMALVALERCGVLLPGALDGLVDLAPAVEPDQVRHAAYARRQEAFQAAHAALGPIHAQLRP